MPYNTKGLLTDTVAKPIPQYFNPTADDYEPLYGRNGAMWVELYNVQPTITTWHPTLSGFDPGVSQSSNVMDFSAAPGYYAVGLGVDCDQPMQVEFLAAPGGGTGTIPSDASTIRMRAVLPATTSTGTAEYVPAFRPIGGRGMWRLTNRGDAAPTRCTVYMYHFRTILPQVQNLRALLVRNLAIRDTVQHDSSTDPNYVYSLVRFVLGGGKVPIYVANGLNQAVDISIVIRLGGVANNFTLGTKNFAAGANGVITNADFPGIDVPSEIIDVRPKCTVAPTSGTLNVWIDTLVGGV